MLVGGSLDSRRFDSDFVWELVRLTTFPPTNTGSCTYAAMAPLETPLKAALSLLLQQHHS